MIPIVLRLETLEQNNLLSENVWFNSYKYYLNKKITLQFLGWLT